MGNYNSERFELRWVNVVVWVIIWVCSVVLRRTVVGVDWRFNNLSGSHDDGLTRPITQTTTIWVMIRPMKTDILFLINHIQNVGKTFFIFNHETHDINFHWPKLKYISNELSWLREWQLYTGMETNCPFEKNYHSETGPTSRLLWARLSARLWDMLNKVLQ